MVQALELPANHKLVSYYVSLRLQRYLFTRNTCKGEEHEETKNPIDYWKQRCRNEFSWVAI